jgi:hypothetical protein
MCSLEQPCQLLEGAQSGSRNSANRPALCFLAPLGVIDLNVNQIVSKFCRGLL